MIARPALPEFDVQLRGRMRFADLEAAKRALFALVEQHSVGRVHVLITPSRPALPPRRRRASKEIMMTESKFRTDQDGQLVQASAAGQTPPQGQDGQPTDPHSTPTPPTDPGAGRPVVGGVPTSPSQAAPGVQPGAPGQPFQPDVPGPRQPGQPGLPGAQPQAPGTPQPPLEPVPPAQPATPSDGGYLGGRREQDQQLTPAQDSHDDEEKRKAGRKK